MKLKGSNSDPNLHLPRLLLNTRIVENNIRTMAEKARLSNVEFRPHFKTHQSKRIGQIFSKYGVKGITVSSARMAHYFAEDGWKDVTIAFPSPIHEIESINAFEDQVNINLLISDRDSANYFNDRLKKPCGVYIELNSGQNRSGICFEEKEQISRLIDHIRSLNKLKLVGFYCHAGQTYRAKSADEAKQMAMNALGELKSIKDSFPSFDVCFGDTPSCSLLNDFGAATQISPGNFVFYDLMQVNIGSADYSEIAVVLECPVVEKHPARNQLIIHGGAVHFSKDALFDSEGNRYFGLVSDSDGKPLVDNRLIAVSQEHGVIQCTENYLRNTNVGDRIRIYPVHSCLTANLMGAYVDMHTLEEIDHIEKRP